MARSPISIALAACTFELTAPADGSNLVSLQLTPTGDFKPWDGRDLPSGHWHIDQAVAAKVISNFTARRNDRVLDYEHQTLLAEKNGQPAPAAGWIKGLEWREGSGLWGTVELTARAGDAIAAKEYRYVSPVFSFDRRTGDVLDIQMAAITNNPAIDGMEPLALRAAATFGIQLDTEETTMKKSLLATAIALLALNANATEEDAVAALTARLEADPLAKVRKALGVEANVTEDVLVTACTALKTKADTAATAAQPDPAKFVPVSVVEDLKKDLAVLSAKVQGDDVEKLVEKGLADGRLLKGQAEWARNLGKSDLAALTAYLDTAQPIVALTATQTANRRAPVADKDNNLTEEELAVCSATGIDPKDFAAAKA
ncbi:phage I-like protein [Dyella sp. SG562]|uniref:phage protease n=1 Tax=Dyella sp. SG562 TaxID=2587017 RepID=UPI00141FE3D6|nr:phage protease [Dyella sp. SG562]NII74212.1 phage I-like protein [Dyella sp. SG562]